VTASLPSGTAEQMRDLQEPSEFYFFVGRVAISSREITHMQVGQCGNQEAYAEILHRRRRRRSNCSNRRPRRVTTAIDSNSPKVHRRED
jgi:hypothetical protein